ncbi:MAG TPA: AI-2E family transporter [Candidatus Pacearchaeota archaeon]|nr:putative inner membrane protein [archaeon BMS3Abin17]HDK41984.1 AI-2E family transporter [Candidatus Pacearchaeota archaeon]HDZ61477.1 AI-2E family transporter [Candidatus Pacearchaeota archaeon]
MDETYFKRIMTTIVLVVLIVLAFFLIKPILLSIISGIILAFIFTPVYVWINKKVKSKNLSASLVCAGLILVILLPFWFLTPIFIDQSIKVYIASQQTDFTAILQSIFPDLFASDNFSSEVGSIMSSFVTKITNSLTNSFSNLILNFPVIFLHLLVVFFTFFFVLRDRRQLVEYIQSLLPFSADVEKKIFESSKGITVSVIYGQVIIGMIQGVVAGIGFFIFRVPNALFLTLMASLAGIFPIIGTTIIWIPTVIYLFVAGNTFQAVGVLLFGLVSSSVDNLIRPIIVSRRTRMHSSLILIGMIGGLFMFGILGFILGPLILAYLLILLELYRKKKSPGIFIQEPIKG